MKWTSRLNDWCMRELDKYQASMARRWPDRNVCCHCAYDLSGIADPPPAVAEAELNCPECGASVGLRDHWWTDGRYSLRALILYSSAAQFVVVLGRVAAWLSWVSPVEGAPASNR